jgi:hypothetical protein
MAELLVTLFYMLPESVKRSVQHYAQAGRSLSRPPLSLALGVKESCRVEIMILVFLEDGTLDVIGSQEDALREYEGIDVEDGVYKFFNEKGQCLEPVFTEPNKRESHFFGFVKTIESGIYKLELKADKCEYSFEELLSEVEFLNKNDFFGSLEEIKAKYNATT